jgi:hypothetical protein
MAGGLDESCSVPVAMEVPARPETETVNLVVRPHSRGGYVATIAEYVDKRGLATDFSKECSGFFDSSRVMTLESVKRAEFGMILVHSLVDNLAFVVEQAIAVLTVNIEMGHEETLVIPMLSESGVGPTASNHGLSPRPRLLVHRVESDSA